MRDGLSNFSLPLFFLLIFHPFFLPLDGKLPLVSDCGLMLFFWVFLSDCTTNTFNSWNLSQILCTFYRQFYHLSFIVRGPLDWWDSVLLMVPWMLTVQSKRTVRQCCLLIQFRELLQEAMRTIIWIHIYFGYREQKSWRRKELGKSSLHSRLFLVLTRTKCVLLLQAQWPEKCY